MSEAKLLMVAVDDIYPDPSQPRQSFDKEELERMTASVKARGILQPIRIRWDAQRSCWVIISGECRWRAAKQAGLATVPCVPVEGELSETELLADQIIENHVRNSLKPMELARSLAKLKALKGCTSQALAKELGISGGSITKAEALLTLPEDIQAMVDDGRVPESAAYEISRLSDEAGQRELAHAVAAKKLNRDRVAEAVREMIGGKPPAARQKPDRVFCKLDGGLSVTFSASGRNSLSWKQVLDALEQLRREARRLADQGKEITELSSPLRAS